jgi:VWFA-related protein
VKYRSGILVLPLLFSMAAAVSAQQAGDSSLSTGLSALAGTDPAQGRIGIDVTVTDAQGQDVTGLNQADFKLLDEGEPLPLASFAASTANGPAPGDPPVSVILVLDEADIPSANFGEAELAAEAFLRSNGGRLKHPVTVYRITSEKLYASIPYSQDGNALADVIASGMNMRPVWKNPALQIVRGPANEIEIGYPRAADAGLPQYGVHRVPVPIALKALGAIAIEQRRVPGRKLLVWIGPGWRVDLKSDKNLFDTITEFSTRLREARIEISIANKWRLDTVKPAGPTVPNPDSTLTVSQTGKVMAWPKGGRYVLTDDQVRRFAAGVSVAQNSNYDNLSLQVLALRTGGGMLTTNDELLALGSPNRYDIPRLIADYVAEASNYYHLTFDPPKTNTVDEYHGLRVELAKPGLTAHTSAGYYDEPVFYDQPMPARDRVTVAQLEQLLAGKHSDRDLAGKLAGLQLTERLSTARLEAGLKRMPGERSRLALTEVGDASVFLPPPSDEVLSLPEPGEAAQQAMLSRMADFVIRQAPRLPNFYADRTTVQYGEPMPKRGQTWKTAQPDRELNYELTTTDHVYFEDGKETTDRQKQKVKRNPERDLLETSGTFGPILVLVLKAAVAPGGTLAWSRWEKGSSGPVAVFQYVSAPSMRTYEIGFCCLALDQALIPFRGHPIFRGELAVDPDTGRILRLTVKADLDTRLPLKNSDIWVEYGPVVMGGKAYICPLRSVSTSRHRRVWEIDDWGMRFKVYGPFETLLNDVTFSRYHLFRAQTTILPGFVPVP